MVREYKTLAYFFHDKMYKQKAERGLIRKVVTALHCSFYDEGAFICEKNKPVENVFFIFTGYANLANMYEIEGKEFGFSIRLPDRSWYGDY
jgi:hypothetical protein